MIDTLEIAGGNVMSQQSARIASICRISSGEVAGTRFSNKIQLILVRRRIWLLVCVMSSFS